MSCRNFWVALLLLVAFASVDALYIIQAQYNDLNCTTPSGAYAYIPLPNTTLEECAQVAGKCFIDVGPVIPSCSEEDPLLSIPEDHVAAVSYTTLDQCNEGNYTYEAAIAGPFNKCVAAPLLGYFKAGGCGANENATGTFYETVEDCEANSNGTTYSQPPNVCIKAFSYGIKFVCPSAAPVAPPVAPPVALAPMAVPVSVPTRKSSSSISNATFGWMSFGAAWIVSFL